VVVDDDGARPTMRREAIGFRGTRSVGRSVDRRMTPGTLPCGSEDRLMLVLGTAEGARCALPAAATL
jgi:hypothetical protein